MCGICGIYNFSRELSVDERLIRKMCNVLQHRGPDDEGIYLNKNIGLGHRRLSIIDLSCGKQPMSNEDSTIWITYNGEIYNYLELRQDLILKGHQFKTNSDTEVIIHLYEEFGENCVDRLNGMFAFAIWNSQKQRLFLARDRFGIKPLYYYADRERFIFASEIKAILQEKGIRPELNHEALIDYLTFQFCLGNKTFFKGINKLLPGHLLILDTGDDIIQPEEKRYWQLNYTIDINHTEDGFSDKLLRLLSDSVRLQLRSDVPLGAHLSGGMDSSTITCMASSLLTSRIKTFTGSFREGKYYDETAYAKIVSEFAKTEYYEVVPTYRDFEEIFPKLIYYLDEPVAGPGVFPQYYVSKLASENVKVVLGGQGGDEIFGGYIRYIIAYLEESIKGAIFKRHEEGDFVVTLESIIPNLCQLQGYLPLLQNFWREGIFKPKEERYFRLISKFNNLDKVVSKEIIGECKDYSVFDNFKRCFNAPPLESLFNQMTNFEINTLLPALLQVEDRMSMAVSLESRVPLLDHRIAELYATMPPTIKFKGGMTKYLFRKTVKNIIPQEIFNRTDKMGFPVPFKEWADQQLKGYVNDILLSKRAKERGIINIPGIEKILEKETWFGRKLWGLLCIEMWFKVFIDGECS